MNFSENQLERTRLDGNHFLIFWIGFDTDVKWGIACASGLRRFCLIRAAPEVGLDKWNLYVEPAADE